MRNAAREAALNVIFARQFNTDGVEALKKKIYKQFALEEDDLLFAADLIATFLPDDVVDGLYKAVELAD